MWGLSRELDHTGGTASPVGAVLPWGMSNHAVSIGFITLLAATTPVPENNLNILGERPNAIFLSPWSQKGESLSLYYVNEEMSPSAYELL